MSRRYRKNNAREFISIMSYLARQFILPNPFANIFVSPVYAEIVNWIFGGIFVPLSFLLTKIWYVSGINEKWEGSLGFFVNYCILTGLLLLISKFISNIYWIIGIFVVVYLILCFIDGWLLNKNNFVF